MLGAAVLPLILLAPSGSSTLTFAVALDGLQNVPPIPAVTATGTATFTLNEAHTDRPTA